ncbi:MAG: septum formation initiator family protein [Desulfobacteraceae bacterium]|nr:septum formation initiator family protein [Desulfobacteraceae bacterium]
MISKQQILLSFAIAGLFFMCLLIVFGDKGFADLNMMKKVRDGLKEKNESLMQENLSLYRSIERLKTDPAYIEFIARQEMGVIGKNELIFKIQNSKPVNKNSEGDKSAIH